MAGSTVTCGLPLNYILVYFFFSSNSQLDHPAAQSVADQQTIFGVAMVVIALASWRLFDIVPEIARQKSRASTVFSPNQNRTQIDSVAVANKTPDRYGCCEALVRGAT